MRAGLTGGVRYAPSPTGRFHLGNLRTAWISWLWAQCLQLPWVVRFEDIDRPRVLAGAREKQLEDMAALGLKPDVLLLQSDFHSRHLELFERAVELGAVYPCDCSRKEVQSALASLASAPHEGTAPVYSGHCRDLDPARELKAAETVAWRFRMTEASGHDDFIVARTSLSRGDFVPAYHWACAIDDYDGGYDLLVRAWDLESSAPLQRAIQAWLGSLEGVARVPAVFHTSLVVQNDGARLEKRTRGVTLDELGAQGMGTRELLAKFASGFDSGLLPRRLGAGEVGGESEHTRSLVDLGL